MKQIILLLIILPFFFSCSNHIQEENADKLSWTKNAVMYEVNVRQFTPEGTFNAFSKHLTRIKKLGVDIIWFMPIHEIGQVNMMPSQWQRTRNHTTSIPQENRLGKQRIKILLAMPLKTSRFQRIKLLRYYLSSSYLFL